MFTRLATDSFAILPVSRLKFRTAARFADQHVLGVRAGDVLHLAVCADHGATALHTRPAARRDGFGAGCKEHADLTVPQSAFAPTLPTVDEPSTYC
jgi:hypothetical protein